jgi:hypothetical protein
LCRAYSRCNTYFYKIKLCQYELGGMSLDWLTLGFWFTTIQTPSIVTRLVFAPFEVVVRSFGRSRVHSCSNRSFIVDVQQAN